jgi:glutaredoxin
MKKKGVGEITLYTLPYCDYCQILKQSLKEMFIPFKDIDVDKQYYIGDQLEQQLQTESYPIIHCKKTDKEYIYILSQTNLEVLDNIRIFNTIDEALELLLTYYYEI